MTVANSHARLERVRAAGRKALLVLTAVPVLAFGVLWTQSMWAWFVVPLGAPPVSFAQAFGLDLFVTVLVGKRDERGLTESGLADVAGGLLGAWALGAFAAWLAGTL